MKIVNKEKFFELPNNTLYSHYGKSWISGLYVKGENFGEIDYTELCVISCVDANNSTEFVDILDDAELNGTSFELNYEDNFGRNGMYDKDEMFIVYEKQDIKKLISFLKTLNYGN